MNFEADIDLAIVLGRQLQLSFDKITQQGKQDEQHNHSYDIG